MKKFFYIFVVLVFVGTGFSQHINVVNQTGIDNGSKVVQEYLDNGSNNYAPHIAYIDQVGNYNESDVYQHKTSWSWVPGLADVYQEGTYNDSKVAQRYWEHKAWITQVGHNNKSDVFQWGWASEGTVTQVGNWNDAMITVYNNDQFFGLTYGIISQYGISNKSYQTLGNDDARKVQKSTFISYQSGNYNESNQTLLGMGTEDWGGTNTYNNHGTATQYGTYNNSEQRIEPGTLTTFAAFDNYVSLYQNGHNNNSEQFMKRNDNSSVVTQVGNWNTSVSQQNW